MKHIAHIYTSLPEKFGVPRQAGLAPSLKGRIVFEPEYRIREAFRGLEDFSHIWILWEFSKVTEMRSGRNTSESAGWSPTVRPPRLGGNKRIGVFATRSPFRPNPIGMSAVKLEAIDYDCPDGPVLYVSGPDMVSGTPIYDIKPYIPYADIRADATGSFADENSSYRAEVAIDDKFLSILGHDRFLELKELLAQDPRPSYQSADERIYGMSFAGFEVSFRASGSLITVLDIT